MPVHKLSLSRGDRARLEVRGADLGKHSWEVLLHGKLLTSFSTHEEIVAGRTLTLEDGSTLFVRLDEHKSWLGPTYVLRVERNGVLLHDAPAHPSRAIRDAAAILWALGLLILFGGFVFLFAPTTLFPAANEMVRAIAGGYTVFVGLLTVAFGYAASREKRWGLIGGIVVLSFQVVGSLVGMSACGILLYSVGLIALIRALRAHRKLVQVDAAALARVFE